MTNALTVSSRFCGPPGTGNGGYVCRCRVIAWPQARDGRKFTAGSALVGPDGDVLAVAATLWLTVPHPAQAPAVQAAGSAS
jgi:hypothetical protein